MRHIILVPYVLFLFLVLAPVGLAAYALASVARTISANLRAGWNDHV